MDAEIRRTTVTPTEVGSVVQLHISDAPLDDESAALVLHITVSLPKYGQAILLAQAQREAMRAAQKVLSSHLQELAKEIGPTGFELEPR